MNQPRAASYLVGVFLIAQSLLVLEVVLTRIFSVVLYYHFAVLSISLALFGTATAGVLIYLFPSFFRAERRATLLSRSSLAYSISVLATFAVFLRIPLMGQDLSASGFVSLAVVYIVLAIPFFFGGLCLSLTITQLASNVSLVYFADLIGAASGCLLALGLLDILGGPGAIVAVSVIGALASIVFSGQLRVKGWSTVCVAWSVATIAILLLNAQYRILQIEYVKGQKEQQKVYEQWNSFSRITVFPENNQGQPFGWGLSDRRQYENPGWMRLTIDGMAETPIFHFNGDQESVRFLKDDVSSSVYYLKSNPKVLVIGPGGGRDVLSALMFGASRVEGVELNPLIVDAVSRRFGAYSGHVYNDPRVQIFIDDGRNFLAKSANRYDIIQASAVDTWAATGAGAFALSENTLYTQEAFRTYWQHLTSDGILAFSRFVYPSDRYGEALRLVGLGLVAWQSSGAEDPRQHLVMIGKLNPSEDKGYVTLLLKRSPFTPEEIKEIERVSDQMGFSLLYAPFGQGHGLVRDLVTATDYESFWRSYPIDISPPTDDRPFFFQMLRLTDILRIGVQRILQSPEKLRVVPVATLGALLVTVTFLSLAFILGPMWLRKKHDLRGTQGILRLLIYFACLGAGYMMVEVGLVQKFVLFLGHPTYSLAVVLFSLLLSSGLGSFTTRRIEPSRATLAGSRIGLILGLLLLAYILLLPYIQSTLMGLDQTWKIIISICSLFPIGLLMGMLFPLGIKFLTLKAEPLIPWCWAINGAASVFASVFAIAVGLQMGMRAEMIGGWLAYLVACCILLSFVLAYQPHMTKLRSILGQHGSQSRPDGFDD